MNITPCLRRITGALLVIGLLAAIPAYAQDDLPSSARIDGVRHVPQTWNNCGAANLTQVLSYYGWGFDQSVASSYLKPNVEDKNVSPGQMVEFVNHQQQDMPNLRALWRYGGTIELIKKFLAAGFPVIAESGYDVQDLGWMGHYETVVAYDDESQTFWVYDSYLGIGNGYGREHAYEEFDSWWKHFNRAFIVVFTVDQEQLVRDVLGPYVDPTYAAEVALDVARQEASTDPSDNWAWFNAGTSAAKLGRYNDAAIYFDEAFDLGMPYRTLWYQFGPYEAYYQIGRYDDVVELANNTASTTLYVEENNYWRGMAYAALGRTEDAIFQFNETLSFNRNFVDAQTAITLLETNAYAPPAPPQ
jgi:tetratricopeptide (TPR) repeat protein